MHTDEWRIDRRAGHHRPPLAEGLHRERQSWHQTTQMNNLLERNFNTAPDAQIIDHRLVETRMRLRVTKNSVIHAPMEGLKNFRRRRKIHVCHPKWIQLGPAVVFDAARAFSFDPMVKIFVNSTHPPFVATYEREF